jgi:hypothetical protein
MGPLVGCRAGRHRGFDRIASGSVNKSLVLGELTIAPQQTAVGAPIELFWRGRSTDRHPSRAVVPYVAEILTAAKEQSASVRLHFETIEHMNSSTITAIIHIIQDARTRAIPLVISFDRTKMWQKLSFDALSVFVKDDKLFQLVSE